MSRHCIVSYDQRENASKSRRLIVFNHVMKCGGMSLLAVLGEHFGDGHYPAKVDHYTDWLALARGSFKDKDAPALSLGGHAAWGVEALFEKPKRVFYVTMLREPFALCRSLFRYSRTHYAPPMSFGKFARQAYPSNLMVKTLADGDLELAKERLAGHYFHFSLLEFFDQGLAMLRHYLGLPQRDYQGRNASSSELVPVELDGDAEQSFYRRNALDVELYDFAKNLFAERLASFRRSAGGEVVQGKARGGVVELAAAGNQAEPILRLLRAGRIAEAVQAMERLPAEKIPHRELARYYVQLGDADKGLRRLRSGMEKQPWLLWHEMEICEQTGQIGRAFELASSMLEKVRPLCTEYPEDAYINRFAYDALVTMSRLAYLKGDRAAAGSAQSEAHDLLPSRMRPRYDGVPLREHAYLQELAAEEKRVLVMRFGPLPVLQAFTDAVRRGAWEMDILVQPSVARAMPAEAYASVYLLPNERFSYRDDADSLPGAVTDKPYAAVIIICNDQDLLTYDDVFSLCARMSCEKTYVYPMSSSLADGGDMKLFDVSALVRRHRDRGSDKNKAARS